MESPTVPECHEHKEDSEEKCDVLKSEISEEMDNLALRFLDIIESIVCDQDRLQEILKNGYVNMAKARYIMGNKSVSMLQINEGEFIASRRIHADTDSYENVEYVNFKLCEECHHDAGKHPEVRHRKVKHQDDLVGEMGSLEISEENLKSVKQKNETRASGIRNPLQWFGVLVPQSLRMCQSHFMESLVIVAKIASLKSELVAVQERYKELQAKKKGIKHVT